MQKAVFSVLILATVVFSSSEFNLSQQPKKTCGLTDFIDVTRSLTNALTSIQKDKFIPGPQIEALVDSLVQFSNDCLKTNLHEPGTICFTLTADVEKNVENLIAVLKKRPISVSGFVKIGTDITGILHDIGLLIEQCRLEE